MLRDPENGEVAIVQADNFWCANAVHLRQHVLWTIWTVLTWHAYRLVTDRNRGTAIVHFDWARIVFKRLSPDLRGSDGRFIVRESDQSVLSSRLRSRETGRCVVC